MPERSLDGRRILIVEDEYFLARDLLHDLTKAGATVVGPVPTVAEALDLLEAVAALDGAILDVNLGGETVYPVADRLMERGVPFVFVTGYDHAALPSRYAEQARYEKPIDRDALISAVGRTVVGP